MAAISLIDPPDAFLDALKERLGPNGWRDPADAPGHLVEPRGKARGRAALILRPQSTDEVAAIVRDCAASRVGVVPYGGGTGLVGGQVSIEGPRPVVLSLERMNRIRAVDIEDDAMIVEAGCTLEAVQTAAAEADRLFPLSYASEGSARIGGALSVNSGGVQVLRYGNARDLCLGLEAILPDGSTHHGLKPLRKDNTGYDLRHLLIGAEGTLGVVTAAALKLFPRPADTATAFCAIPSPAHAITLLRRLQSRLGEIVSAFELIARAGLDFRDAAGLGPSAPIAERHDWSVLIEIGGRGARAALEEALAEAFEAGLALDGVLAESEAQRQALWAVRETIPEANRLVGAIASHDVSTPIARLPAFIDAAGAAVAAIDPAFRVNCFGHIGDGNLHYNVFPPEGRAVDDYRDRAAEITTAVHDLVDAHGGSISAEHGVGRFKTADLARYGDPAKLAAMRAIKDALDPHGVMNPGAVFGMG